jgi:threonine/homoserine/homoserine lactone efflux protein
MIAGTKFIVFLSAPVVLAVMPGPGILYVLGRTLNGVGAKVSLLRSAPFSADWFTLLLPQWACPHY